MKATKWNAGDKGFALKNDTIIAVVVKEVNADQSEGTDEMIINTTEEGDEFADDQIFSTPEEIGRKIVSDFYAANQSASEAPTATAAGSDAAPAPVDASFTIDPLTVNVGETTTAKAVTPGGEWKSENEAVATIDGDGVITGVSNGTTLISYELENADPATENGVQVTIVS